MPIKQFADTLHLVSYDTIHTTFYDTIKIYDTLRTIHFDTVNVALDSNFSISVLHSAENFYSNSFNFLLMVCSIFFALLAIFYGIKIIIDYTKVNNLKKEQDKIQKQLEEITNISKDFTDSTLTSWFAQGQLAHQQKDFLIEFACYGVILEFCSKHPYKEFIDAWQITIDHLQKILSLPNFFKNQDIKKELRTISNDLEKLKEHLKGFTAKDSSESNLITNVENAIESLEKEIDQHITLH